jgi:hypothetical protein
MELQFIRAPDLTPRPQPNPSAQSRAHTRRLAFDSAPLLQTKLRRHTLPVLIKIKRHVGLERCSSALVAKTKSEPPIGALICIDASVRSAAALGQSAVRRGAPPDPARIACRTKRVIIGRQG